ncbi:MAG: ABC transporter substrate-binding protein [Elainellaceae cyanobacterium]
MPFAFRSRKLNRSRKLKSILYRCFCAALGLALAIATSSCQLNWYQTQAAQIPRLVISEISDPKTFNPVMSQEVTSVFGLLYEGLMQENGITGELELALAESLDISEDQKRIVFTLRDGLLWSDGEPFTVDDILFTYNDIYFNPSIPSGESDILRIGEEGLFPTVNKLDERRVEFVVPEPFAPFLRYAGGITILPEHILGPTVNEMDMDGNPRFLSVWGTDTDPASIIGNGPYRMLSYSPGQRVIFERNPHYWKNTADSPQPFIERFVLQIVESTDASLLQFRSGGLDVIAVPPENFALLKREEDRGGFQIYEDGPRPGTNFISFNLNQGSREGKPLVDPIKSAWFTNPDFRRAIAYAIDRDTMINNIFQGLGEPQTSPISVQSPYYLPPGDGLETYDYSVETAKALLTDAGFEYDAEGKLQDGEGHPVRFTLITNAGNKIREAIGAQVKRDLLDIGIQVDFQPIAFNTLVDKLSNTLDWDCFILGLSGGVEPNSGANVWRTDGTLHTFNQSALPGQPPIDGWTVYDWEAEISNLYIQAAQELDEEKRKALYAETQRLTQAYLPYIYLVNPLSLGAVRNRLENVQYSALGGALWNVEALRLSEQ